MVFCIIIILFIGTWVLGRFFYFKMVTSTSETHDADLGQIEGEVTGTGFSIDEKTLTTNSKGVEINM